MTTAEEEPDDELSPAATGALDVWMRRLLARLEPDRLLALAYDDRILGPLAVGPKIALANVCGGVRERRMIKPRGTMHVITLLDGRLLPLDPTWRSRRRGG